MVANPQPPSLAPFPITQQPCVTKYASSEGAALAHAVRRTPRSPGAPTCAADACTTAVHGNASARSHRVDADVADAAAAHAAIGGGGSTEQPADVHGVSLVFSYLCKGQGQTRCGCSKNINVNSNYYCDTTCTSHNHVQPAMQMKRYAYWDILSS